MKYYSLKETNRMFISDAEDLLLHLIKGICQIECGQLRDAIKTFTDLEVALLTADIESMKFMSAQITKFYLGVATYYSGDLVSAGMIFNRVIEISKGKLKE